MKTYGTLKVTSPSGVIEVNVTKLVRFSKLGRVVTIAYTDEDCILLSIENTESSGRGNHSMYLSKDSFAILSLAMMVFGEKSGMDLHKMLGNIFPNGVEYESCGFGEDLDEDLDEDADDGNNQAE